MAPAVGATEGSGSEREALAPQSSQKEGVSAGCTESPSAAPPQPPAGDETKSGSPRGTDGAERGSPDNNNPAEGGGDPRPAAGGDVGAPSKSTSQLLEETLFRMTEGLPLSELRLIVSESEQCEEQLKADIRLLERALERDRKRKKMVSGADDDEMDENDDGEAVQALVESPFTPLDAFWTASALLGRLQGELALPRHPALQPLPVLPAPSPTAAAGSGVDHPTRQLELLRHPHYTAAHDSPHALLALHKKVSTHRSAAVFRRPVKAEEAPGYDTRILFPMDLSLVRKQIVARQVNSYADLHRRLGLIAFNCLKFNGRESDYGAVAKEFEQAADEMVWHAVVHHGSSSSSSSVAAPGSSRGVTAPTGGTTPTSGTAVAAAGVSPGSAAGTAAKPPAEQPTEAAATTAAAAFAGPSSL